MARPRGVFAASDNRFEKAEEYQGNRIKTANKKACDYSICGSTTISLRRLKYT